MEHTPGPWRKGKYANSVVSDSSKGMEEYLPGTEKEFYDGYLIAESITPNNRPIIMAAPDLLAVAQKIKTYCDGIIVGQPQKSQLLFELYHELGAAIAKAKGQEDG